MEHEKHDDLFSQHLDIVNVNHQVSRVIVAAELCTRPLSLPL